MQTKSFVTSLVILHGAMTAGTLLFIAIAYFVDRTDTPSSDSQPFIFVVPILAIGCLLASFYAPKGRIQAAKAIPDLDKKLELYRGAQIIKYAVLEGAALFGVVAYLTDYNIMFLAISAILLVAMIWVRPTRDRIIADLSLNSREQAVLQ